jgi:hypothetical protein
MNVLKVLCCLCCLVTLFTACKKDDEPRPPCPQPAFRKIGPALKDYLFDTGSWWIYQNELDSTYDTLTMRSFIATTYSDAVIGGTGNQTGGCPSTTYEGEMFISMYLGTGYHEEFTEYIRNDIITRGGPYTGHVFFPGTAGQSSTTAHIEAVHDSLVIGGHTFYHVTQVRLSGTNEPWWPTRLFYAPNVGVIRKEFDYPASTVPFMNLVDWQVTMYPY